MPTYVYKFIDSGETIEVQQSFSDDALTEAVHPGTGAVMPVKKVFLPVGVTFKGGGFYKTDSRGGSSSTTPSPTTGTPAAAPTSSGSESAGSSSGSSTPAPASTPAPSSSSSSSSNSSD